MTGRGQADLLPCDVRFPRQPPLWAFGVFCALLLLAAGRPRPALRGDGREYILQTQALVLRGALGIDTAAARDYWNRTNPFGVELDETRPPARELIEDNQAGGGFGALYPDRFGAYRFVHFWGYSLAVAPVYLLLHHLGGAGWEYRAFYLVNLLCLLLPFGLAWRWERSWTLWVVSLLALLTPLPAYVVWPHPELFCFGLTLAALMMAGRPRLHLLSVLLLAAAAIQNWPILFFFPLHLLLAWQRRTAGEPRAPFRAYAVRLVAGYLPAALAVLLALAWSRYFFGAWNLIAALGLARLDYATGSRMLDFFLSPLVGAFWFYAPCFVLAPALAGRRQAAWLVAAALVVVAAAWLATATANFNSDQAGALRYAAWLLAPLWLVALRGAGAGRARRAPFVGAVAAALLISGFIHGAGRLDGASGTPRLRSAAILYRWLHYADDPEVLAENIMGREVPYPAAFNGAYLWNLGPRDTLWLISRRWADLNPALMPKLAQGAAWRRHPVLGDYLLLWKTGPVRHLDCDGPTFIRDGQGGLLQPSSG